MRHIYNAFIDLLRNKKDAKLSFVKFHIKIDKVQLHVHENTHCQDFGLLVHMY
jgi:hypothetical protein